MRELLAGAVLLVVSIIWEGLTYWSVLDATIAKLKDGGPSGILLAGIVTSPLFVATLAVIGLVFGYRGLSGMRNGVKNPSLPPNPGPVTVNVSPSISPTISPTINIGVSVLPDRRPKITFFEWKFRDYTYNRRDSGFVLENHGEAALEVKVMRFQIATDVFAESAMVATIGESRQEFALVWIEGFPHIDMGKWDLPAAMKKAADERDGGRMYRPNYIVPVSVTYRDFDNNRYMSVAELSYVPARGELVFGPANQQKLT
jgi:hypothetical protein